MLDELRAMMHRCWKRAARREQFVKRTAMLTFVIAIVVFLLVFVRPVVIRWQLLNMAGDRRLLTFHSTPYWGIGNEMFAFSSTLAAARSTAMASNKTLLFCFDAKLSLRVSFAPLADWPACNPVHVLQLPKAHHRRESAYARYDWRLVHRLPTSQHIVLDRFMQSWKYFADIQPDLRRLFQFSDNVQQAAAEVLTEAVDSDLDRVLLIGLHVRHGDIVTKQSLLAIGYVAADLSYIDRAMDFMDHHLHVDSYTGLDASGHRRVFVVCSDDIDWCRRNIPTHRHVVFVSTQDAIVDLAVLSMCRHTIITVGTFGWWGAWLANGTTVYFKDWPRRGSALEQFTGHADYFPRHWVPL